MSKRRERWRWVPGYEGRYAVSDCGDVLSAPHGSIDGCILKRRVSNNGYLSVSLFYDGTYRNELVHRLVAKAFIPNPDGKPQVNHINGDRQDNRVENLEWATASENIKHKYEVLGYEPDHMPSKLRKFTDEQVRAIRKDSRKASLVAQEYGVSRQTIADIRKKKTYKEVI